MRDATAPYISDQIADESQTILSCDILSVRSAAELQSPDVANPWHPNDHADAFLTGGWDQALGSHADSTSMQQAECCRCWKATSSPDPSC